MKASNELATPLHGHQSWQSEGKINMVQGQKICKRCIMNDSDPDIFFDENGFCNHCHEMYRRLSDEVLTGDEAQTRLKILVNKIKNTGTKTSYDCLIGVSGGVDSTYVAMKVKELGFNPIAVHLDNGWDSELAVSNIQKTLKKLDIDLLTYVIDWEEFKDLQLSFLHSSFINAEIPSDHAITAILFHLAAKHNIKYIIGGSNIATEGILPRNWVYDHRDWKFIKSIHRRFGSRKLKTFPRYTLQKMAYYIFVKRIKYISLLNYVEYNKDDAIQVLRDELDWKYYGGKHYESIYTRFYQGYILPNKFGVDKRRAHLSTLICADQISRDEALKTMDESGYDQDQCAEDREYAIKKLGLSEDEFEKIMNTPAVKFNTYPNHDWILNKTKSSLKWIKKFAMEK